MLEREKIKRETINSGACYIARQPPKMTNLMGQSLLWHQSATGPKIPDDGHWIGTGLVETIELAQEFLVLARGVRRQQQLQRDRLARDRRGRSTRCSHRAIWGIASSTRLSA